MSGATSAIMAVAAVASAAVSYKNGQAQQQSAEKAAKQAKANADKQASAAEQDFNRANQKHPDTNAALSAASESAKGGAGGTMLTGPQGVDPNALTLGKSTLLGQ